MRIPFAVLLAWREGRASVRRIGLYGLSIAIGVGAMVSVHSFREDVARSIRAQARTLMGADARFEANRPLEAPVLAVLDSLAGEGASVAELVSAGSMVAAAEGMGVRLLQVRGVGGGWPLYGEVMTEPLGIWGRLDEPGLVLVDRAVLTQLDVAVGDTLLVGTGRLAVAGVVDEVPTELGFQTALGPRIWVGRATLDELGLLGFGSLARYERFVAVDDPDALEGLDDRYADVLGEAGVDYDTARDQARQLTRAVGFMSDFLGLVGLGALLLGGIGVASAIHVFVKERLNEVAVLRCIGARQGSVFSAYLLQSAGLGLVGALLGAVLGVAVQQFLPGAVAGVLPIDVDTELSWPTMAGGVGIGVWVSALFALLPLLAIRDVPPLRAIRHAVEGGRRLDAARIGAGAALALSVLALSMLEAPRAEVGLAFALALSFTTFMLWLAGLGVIQLARRFFPRRAPYPVRQGFSNLFRPANQTVAVTLALGFGAFIVGTVVLVQRNLEREFRLEAAEGTPNLLLFDIQTDQVDGVLGLIPEETREGVDVTPIIPGRLVRVNGRGADELDGLPEDERPRGWAVRREYRHTWRAELSDAETLVEGAWWPDAPPAPEGVARVSLETEVAADLRVGIGDTLTWSIGGREVPTLITSLRTVDWERFQTNFFVVFEPGSLDGAPGTTVALARVDGDEALAQVQRDLVLNFPNVSALDVGRVREVVEGILSRVDQAVRFLAAFSAVAGLVVLAGALAASRHQRLREGALLKTIGARRGQLLTVLFSEYVALGSLAAASGLALAVGSSWALVGEVFGLRFEFFGGALAGIWGGIVVLTLVTGLLGSRGLLVRPPLPVLRDLAD